MSKIIVADDEIRFRNVIRDFLSKQGYEILEAKDLGNVSSSVGILPLIIGCLTAFVVGLISLKFLMKLINKGKLEYFAFYLIPVGILGLIFL